MYVNRTICRQDNFTFTLCCAKYQSGLYWLLLNIFNLVLDGKLMHAYKKNLQLHLYKKIK